MSQSATFYLIGSEDFAAIQRNRNNLELLNNKAYVTFYGTHEGLRFVLSEGLDKQQTDLVNEIFYPVTYIGGTAQHVRPTADEEQEFSDVTDNEEYDDFDSEPVTYHTTKKVKEITTLLNTISDEQLLKQFDPEELNRQKIYPWCWNSNEEANQSYNRRHLAEDYQNLKNLFNSAEATGSYLLCFVG